MRELMASPAARRDWAVNLRPLLPGLITRIAELSELLDSKGIVFAPSDRQWLSAMKQAIFRDRPAYCGRSDCKAYATAEAPFKCCARCKWVLYCSPDCSVRSLEADVADPRAAGQLARAQADVYTPVLVIDPAAAYLPPRGDVRSDRAVLIWLAAPLSRCRRDSSWPWSCVADIPARPALTRSRDGRSRGLCVSRCSSLC